MSAKLQPPPEFDDLTVDERIDYVQTLWGRITESGEPPIPEWHKEVLDKRLANTNRELVPWEEVRDNLRAQLSKISQE